LRWKVCDFEESLSNPVSKETNKPKTKRGQAPSVILTTWEAETGRIVVRRQLEQIVLKTPISKVTKQNGLEMWLKW
jgi:hypothetical protein